MSALTTKQKIRVDISGRINMLRQYTNNLGRIREGYSLEGSSEQDLLQANEAVAKEIENLLKDDPGLCNDLFFQRLPEYLKKLAGSARNSWEVDPFLKRDEIAFMGYDLDANNLRDFLTTEPIAFFNWLQTALVRKTD
jgi:hypothetical protein